MFICALSRYLVANFLFAIVITCATSPRSFAAEIQIASSDKVDERLFLIRLLENMYEVWPTDVSDRNTFVAQVKELRVAAIRIREHCRREKLGFDLEKCFGDYVECLDAYMDFLAKIGQIENSVARRAKQDELDAGLNAGRSGLSIYGAMRQGNSGGGEAAVGALIVGGIQYLIESSNKAAQREEDAKQAVQRAAREFDDHSTAVLANAQAVARRLTAANGWGKSEAGFELNTQQAVQVVALIQRGDWRGLVRIYDGLLQNRPRDPFLRIGANVHRALANADDVNVILRCAKDCVDAATLVPVGHVYDEYRIMCMDVAIWLAVESRAIEIEKGVSPYGSTAASQFAVACGKWLVKNGPHDTTGEMRAGLAWCLLADAQLEAARIQANEVYELLKDNPEFCYGYACLMSRMGDSEKSLEWLRAAIRRGFVDVVQMKRDPDLANVRTNQANSFADIVKITWRWNIVYGIFNDDIVLTNTSSFPITNVIVDARLEQGSKSWSRRLNTDLLMPGESKTWENVVSIPGGRLTKATVTMRCDQNQ